MKELIINLYEKHKPKSFVYKLFEKIKFKYLMLATSLVSIFATYISFLLNQNVHQYPILALLIFIPSFGILFLLSAIIYILIDAKLSSTLNISYQNLFNHLKENKNALQDELIRLKLISYQDLSKENILDDEFLKIVLNEIDNHELCDDTLASISSKIIFNKEDYLEKYENELILSKEQSLEKIKRHIVKILQEEKDFQDKKQNLLNNYSSKPQSESIFQKSKSLKVSI